MSTSHAWEKWCWRDWKADPQVRSLSEPSRCVWFEILGDMWMQQTDTFTRTPEQWARQVGCSVETFRLFYQEAKETGVCDIGVTQKGKNRYVTVTSRRRRRDLEAADSARENNRLRQQRHRERAGRNVESQKNNGGEIRDQRSDVTTPPNGGESESSAAPTHSDPCPFEKIIALYHELLPKLPRYRKRTNQRDQRMRARWRETPSLDAFREYFRSVSDSEFLQGENDRGWKADLEWLMRAENFAKVVERKYGGAAAPSPSRYRTVE